MKQIRKHPQNLGLSFPLNSEFITIFKKNFEDASMWDAPFHILHDTHCKFCSVPHKKIYKQS